MNNLLNFKSLGWWLYILTCIFLTVQVILNAVPGDSRVFLQAGLNIRNDISPWIASSDPVNFQFLNGPIFSIICCFLSFFGLRGMYLLTCILSIAITPICVFLTANLLKIRFNHRYLGLMSTLFMLSFSFRANLEYGQFMIFYFMLFLYVLVISTSGESSKVQQFLTGIGIVMLIDFKPHIFIFIVCLLFRKEPKHLRFGFIVGALVELLVLKLVSGDFLPYEWVARLSNRGRNSGGLEGYYNLPNLLSELSIPDTWIRFFLPVILVMLFVLSKFYANSTWMTYVLIFLAFNPLMHPQDFPILILLTFLVISQLKKSIFIYLVLGMSIVWSTSLIMIIYSCVVTTLSVFILYPSERTFRAIVGLSALVLPIMLINWAEIFQINSDAYRMILNIGSVVGMYVILASNAKSVGVSNLLHNRN